LFRLLQHEVETEVWKWKIKFGLSHFIAKAVFSGDVSPIDGRAKVW